MKSPRKYLQEKYPEYEVERGLTGHDDIHTESLMLEYAEYYAAQPRVQLAAGSRPVFSIINSVKLYRSLWLLLARRN